MFNIVVLRRVSQGPPKSNLCNVYYHYEYFFLPFVKPNGYFILSDNKKLSQLKNA